MNENIYFPFFTEYEDLIPDMVQFTDKTMLEYRTLPGRKCVINYRVDNDPEAVLQRKE